MTDYYRKQLELEVDQRKLNLRRAELDLEAYVAGMGADQALRAGGLVPGRISAGLGLVGNAYNPYAQAARQMMPMQDADDGDIVKRAAE